MDMRQTWGGYQVVLASASPRRKELMAQIGLEPEIRPSRMEEETREKRPDRVVMELSRQKAEDVASGWPGGTMVIGADTVDSVGNARQGKPGTPMRAYEMLEKIQGRTHQVYTGVTVLLCQGEDRCHGITFAERTDVHVYSMTCGDMKEYAQCGEPLDKAGAYGIQGFAARYIVSVRGDYFNVVGLPVARLYGELKKLGVL